MSLELNKVTTQLESMGMALAARQRDDEMHLERAWAALAAHARVTDELMDKIRRARAADASWRGALPLGSRLDERQVPSGKTLPATLIAVDGSQIYPDRHGVAPYYLINVGSIVLRQGSRQAPATDSQPFLFFASEEIYDERGQLRNAEFVNRQRNRREIERLADLAEAEGEASGENAANPIVAIVDGPLLFWAPERAGAEEAGDTLRDEVDHYANQLTRLRNAGASPVGYVDRPSSANVLRTLELADLEPENITREAVRHRSFGLLADRHLFARLLPGERSGLFASTSEINERLAAAGHRIVFFYANVARRPGEHNAVITRCELPEWAALDRRLLDQAHSAIYADCALTQLPYVVLRAHELALVSNLERAEFEKMLGQCLVQNRLSPYPSAKAVGKRLTARRRAQVR